MTIDPNNTVKDTSTPKVQMKYWGFGQLRLNKQHTLSPRLPQVTQPVLESRQKSIEPTQVKQSKQWNEHLYYNHHTSPPYYKLTKSRK